MIRAQFLIHLFVEYPFLLKIYFGMALVTSADLSIQGREYFNLGGMRKKMNDWFADLQKKCKFLEQSTQVQLKSLQGLYASMYRKRDAEIRGEGSNCETHLSPIILAQLHKEYFKAARNFLDYKKVVTEEYIYNSDIDFYQDLHSEEEVVKACDTMVQQLGLHMCIWGEASNIRFTPEILVSLYCTMYDRYRQVTRGSNFVNLSSKRRYVLV